MKINNKEQLIKHLWLYKNYFFTRFETDDESIKKIIKALNIKSRYKRIEYVYNEICDEIDEYYSTCKLCDFKDQQCILQRLKNLDYKNGCCRKCLHQSSTGCTTKNIACKLFLCSQVDLNKKKIEAKDIVLLKLLNPYQRYVATTDYFATTKQAVMDLYVGPICLLIRIIVRGIIYFIKRNQNENMDYIKQK